VLYVAKCQKRKRDTLDPYCFSYVFQKRKKETLDLKNTLQGTTLFVFSNGGLDHKGIRMTCDNSFWPSSTPFHHVRDHHSNETSSGTTSFYSIIMASVIYLWIVVYRQKVNCWCDTARTDKSFPLFVQFSLQWWLEIYQVQKSSSLFSPRR